jgi:hypothetical protein
MPGAEPLWHGRQPWPCPSFFPGVAAVATLGERLDKHAGTSNLTASDPGIHHAPRVMAQVVGRAAKGSGDGTLAS